MEFRRLNYFLALAAERHFGRAATRLGMTQPALTRQIHHLEREVGAQLFVRVRPLELTPSGEILLRYARTLLELTQHAMDDIGRTSAGELSVLRFGLAPIGPPPAVSQILRRLAARPELEIVARAVHNEERVASVLGGVLDVAVTTSQAKRYEELQWLPVDEDAVVVAVPEGDPAAVEDVVTARDLAGYDWLLPADGTQPPEFRPLIRALLAGRSPRPVDSDLTVQLELVASGVGLILLPAYAAARNVVDGIRYVPLAPAARVAFGLVWRRDAEWVSAVLSETQSA